MRYTWRVNIQGHGTVNGILAETKWEAVERAYGKYCHLEPNRMKYHAKRS